MVQVHTSASIEAAEGSKYSQLGAGDKRIVSTAIDNYLRDKKGDVERVNSLREQFSTDEKLKELRLSSLSGAKIYNSGR